MTIYTRLLAQGTVPSGTAANVYTAPATGVVVVRDIVIGVNSQATGDGAVAVQSGSVFTWLFIWHQRGTIDTFTWQGRQVLLPNDVVNVNAPAGQVFYRITGYVLGV